MAVGLRWDGPQRGEALDWSEPEEGKGKWEEGEGADVRASSSRERRRGAGERALLGCKAVERARGRWAGREGGVGLGLLGCWAVPLG